MASRGEAPDRTRVANRILITEEPRDGTSLSSGFSLRHPEVAYVFGDMLRWLFVVGCLAVDLFVTVQVHLSFPSTEGVLFPVLAVGFLLLAYSELRLYRILWPASRRRRIVEIVEGRGH